jgi:hypothetical protein
VLRFFQDSACFVSSKTVRASFLPRQNALRFFQDSACFVSAENRQLLIDSFLKLNASLYG